MLVGDAQQQGDEDVVGHEGAAAVGDERERDAGQRHDPGDAADDDERLQAEDEGEAGGQQLLERVVGPDGNAQPAAYEEDEGHEQGGGAQQPQLLADCGEDEVGGGGGDALGASEGQAAPGHATRAEGEHRLDDLVAAALSRGPGVEPDLDPGLHMGELLVGHAAGQGEQGGAAQQVHGLPGGQPQQPDEQAEEQQGRPEVPLGHHHHDGDSPCRQQREQHPQPRAGQAQRPEADAVGQQLAPLDQVRREEDGQHDLRQLAGLESDGPEADPDPGAVDVATEPRDQREEQEDQARGQEGVAVAFEVAGPAHQHQRAEEGGHPHGGPDGLEGGEVGVQPGDHRVAEAVEQQSHGQDDGIGVDGEPSHPQVGGHQ